jgi:hypothetical protein
LGLAEFSGLLDNPPPGLDELVALANVFEHDNENDEQFEKLGTNSYGLR